MFKDVSENLNVCIMKVVSVVFLFNSVFDFFVIFVVVFMVVFIGFLLLGELSIGLEIMF